MQTKKAKNHITNHNRTDFINIPFYESYNDILKMKKKYNGKNVLRSIPSQSV